MLETPEMDNKPQIRKANQRSLFTKAHAVYAHCKALLVNI